MNPKVFERHGNNINIIQISADEILNCIVERCDIIVEYSIIQGDLDIEKIRNLLDQSEDLKSVINSKIIIKNSEIRGNFDLSNVIFTNDVIFDYCIFRDTVRFVSNSFNSNASFRTAVFDSEVDFSSTIFNDQIDFISSTFNNNVNFDKAIFNHDAMFSGSTFGLEDYITEANFSLAVFNEYAIFSSASFNGIANFNHAVFNGYTHFAGSSFNRSATFLWTAMKHPANFQGVRFCEGKLRSLIWNQIICPSVSKVTFGKLKLRSYSITDFSEFNTATIMDSSSNPYLKRYIDDEQWIRSWRERKHKFWFILWEITSHCGRSFSLWAMWSAFFAILFAFIYYFGFGEQHFSYNVQKMIAEGRHPNFWSYLYYSVVTFTTLGFGDIVPTTNIARLVVGTEVILGYIMLGGLISIFANKLARRS
ncbi:TPA: hypothetical protein ENX78_08890 [Candidatus Poribacteria bacterium]|nr:hypothetical protein [Candidatus Poribacteria bacterium]